MNIDKSKLQPLLWAVVGAWRAGGQDLQERTDALDEFLCEGTVEEVALNLLEKNEQLKAENEKMRSFLAEVSKTSCDKWSVMAARNLLKEFGHD